jgi:serine/threonine protein kinase
MGEVYRARDTRLNRIVALKLLPTHLSDDPKAKQRFDREAQLISSLTHSNICTVHDVGHQDGINYLVMEYLEGETLADRLMKGALPLEQVLKVGIEICKGLEKAHRSGVIHRDLKPGNIMLTKSGAKLMDFGLAKTGPAVNREATGLALTMASSAGSHPITEQGTVVGTFQYMSPEQVDGKEADTRSDIFALGAVLYEMATGRRAFEGKTSASVIAAVMQRDPPPISTVQPMSPPALDRLVGNCLLKDPDERWQTVHDTLLALRGLALDGAQAGISPAVPSAGRSLSWVSWVIAAMMAIAVVFLVVRNTQQTLPPLSLVRASLLPPTKSSFAPYNFALSPDGTRLAFVAVASDGSMSLSIRSLASGATQEYSNTAEARFPFWSPDGQWVAFFAEGNLKKLEVGSGAVQTLCSAPHGWGGDWNHDGLIIFASDISGPLTRVSAAGSVPSPATKVLQAESAEAQRWPSFLPDGKHFLYQVDWVGTAGTYIGSIDGKESKLLSHDLTGNVQFIGGYLLYVRNSSLMAQPFDPERMQFTGEPIPIASRDIEAEKSFSRGNYSASQAGTLVYLSRGASLSRFEWFDRNGQELGPIGVSGAYDPRLSPDGRYVAYSADPAFDGNRSVWTFDLIRKTATRVTDGDRDGFPAWSPDGKQLVYSGSRADGFGLYVRAADGSGQDQVLAKGVSLPPTDWSHDGRNVLYMNVSQGHPRIYSQAIESTASAREVTPGSEGQISPNGNWLAYTDASGNVFVQPFLGHGGKNQISSNGGAQPRWRADGTELFYIAHDKKLMAVPVLTGKKFVAGTPHALFQTRITGARFSYFQYDVTPDGQRFLVNSLPPENTAPPLTLVLNWNARLKKN